MDRRDNVRQTRPGGIIRQTRPGTIRQTGPGTIRQTSPGTIRQTSPGTIRQTRPNTILHRERSKIVARRGEDPTVLKREGKSTELGRVEDAVAAGLARARKAWREYRANADYDRAAVYVYLEAVFVLIQQWKQLNVADSYSLKALKRQEFSIKMKSDPYARVIYCTSDAGAKTRSEWAKIMQWVARWNKRGRSFTQFVTKNGGLNKCADYAAGDWDPDWT